MEQKQKIAETIDIEDLPLSLDEIAVYIKDLIKVYGGDAILEQDAGYNNISSRIKYCRLETEEEVMSRQQKEQSLLKRQTEKEMKQLNQLAKKHGKKIV